MKRSGPLKRGKPMSRAGRIKPKAKRNPMPPAVAEEVLRRDRQCQAPLYGAPLPCYGALQVHHVRNRGMGGSLDPAIHDPANLLALCARHNGWVEDNPREARDLGLKERNG